jgi:glucan phosphoethanolaminetransferase (alkaline phosphatase superfamily)
MVMMTTSMTGMISVKMLRHRRLCAFTVFVAVMFVYLVVNLLSTDRALSFLSLFMIVAFGFTVVHRIFLDRQRMKTFSPLVIVTASLALYSMTNRIGLGQQTLFEFPLFPPLKQFTETFRTHGRFIWPIYYLAVFSAIIFFVRTTSRKYLPYAIIALLLFQIYDSSNASNLTRQRFTKSPQWSSPLKDSRWGMFAERYDHVVFVPPLNNDPDEIWIAIDELASKYQLSTNSGYFSRYDPSKFVSMTEKYITQINSDQMDDQTIYVLDPKFFPKVYHIPEDMENSIKIMDGFFVITP